MVSAYRPGAIRLHATRLVVGDVLLFSHRVVVAVTVDDVGDRVEVTVRDGRRTFTHRWLTRTPVYVVLRDAMPARAGTAG